MELKFKSRKFWITVLTEVILVILVALEIIPPELAAPSIAGTAGAYMVGNGLAAKNNSRF